VWLHVMVRWYTYTIIVYTCWLLGDMYLVGLTCSVDGVINIFYRMKLDDLESRIDRLPPILLPHITVYIVYIYIYIYFDCSRRKYIHYTCMYVLLYLLYIYTYSRVGQVRSPFAERQRWHLRATVRKINLSVLEFLDRPSPQRRFALTRI